MSTSDYITSRTARRDFDFIRFVEILSTDGYISEAQYDPRCSLGSSAMEFLQQEEFDRLYEFFLPTTHNDIKLECACTNKGTRDGTYAYALFNANKMTRDEMLAILERENRKRPV